MSYYTEDSIRPGHRWLAGELQARADSANKATDAAKKHLPTLTTKVSKAASGHFYSLDVWAYNGAPITGDMDVFKILPHMSRVLEYHMNDLPKLNTGLPFSFPGLDDEQLGVATAPEEKGGDPFQHVLTVSVKKVAGGVSSCTNYEYRMIDTVNEAILNADNKELIDSTDGCSLRSTDTEVIRGKLKEGGCTVRPIMNHGVEAKNHFFAQYLDDKLVFVYPEYKDSQCFAEVSTQDSNAPTTAENAAPVQDEAVAPGAGLLEGSVKKVRKVAETIIKCKRTEVVEGGEAITAALINLAKRGYILSMNIRYAMENMKLMGKDTISGDTTAEGQVVAEKAKTLRQLQGEARRSINDFLKGTLNEFLHFKATSSAEPLELLTLKMNAKFAHLAVVINHVHEKKTLSILDKIAEHENEAKSAAVNERPSASLLDDGEIASLKVNIGDSERKLRTDMSDLWKSYTAFRCWHASVGGKPWVAETRASDAGASPSAAETSPSDAKKANYCELFREVAKNKSSPDHPETLKAFVRESLLKWQQRPELLLVLSKTLQMLPKQLRVPRVGA